MYLIAEKKLPFIRRRIIETFFGGLRVNGTEFFKVPFSIKIVQIVLLLLPIFVNCFVVLAEQNVLISLLATSIPIGLNIIAYGLAVAKARTFHELEENKDNKSDLSDEEIYDFKSFFSRDTLRFIFRSHENASLSNIILRYIYVFFVCGIGFFVCHPNQIDDDFGLDGSPISYVFSFLGVWCLGVSQYQILVGEATEMSKWTNSFFQFQAFNRVTHLLILYGGYGLTAFIANEKNEEYQFTKGFIRIIFTFLWLLWAFGVAPPFQALWEWAAEQTYVLLFGGWYCRRRSRLIIGIYTSAIFAICFMLILTVSDGLLLTFGLLTCGSGLLVSDSQWIIWKLFKKLLWWKKTDKVAPVNVFNMDVANDQLERMDSQLKFNGKEKDNSGKGVKNNLNLMENLCKRVIKRSALCFCAISILVGLICYFAGFDDYDGYKNIVDDVFPLVEDIFGFIAFGLVLIICFVRALQKPYFCSFIRQARNAVFKTKNLVKKNTEKKNKNKTKESKKITKQENGVNNINRMNNINNINTNNGINPFESPRKGDGNGNDETSIQFNPGQFDASAFDENGQPIGESPESSPNSTDKLKTSLLPKIVRVLTSMVRYLSLLVSIVACLVGVLIEGTAEVDGDSFKWSWTNDLNDIQSFIVLLMIALSMKHIAWSLSQPLHQGFVLGIWNLLVLADIHKDIHENPIVQLWVISFFLMRFADFSEKIVAQIKYSLSIYTIPKMRPTIWKRILWIQLCTLPLTIVITAISSIFGCSMYPILGCPIFLPAPLGPRRGWKRLRSVNPPNFPARRTAHFNVNFDNGAIKWGMKFYQDKSDNNDDDCDLSPTVTASTQDQLLYVGLLGSQEGKGLISKLQDLFHSGIIGSSIGALNQMYFIRGEKYLLFVEVIEIGWNFCGLQIKGTELQHTTSCHGVEANFIDETAECAFGSNEAPLGSQNNPHTSTNPHKMALFQPLYSIEQNCQTRNTISLRGILDCKEFFETIKEAYLYTLVWAMTPLAGNLPPRWSRDMALNELISHLPGCNSSKDIESAMKEQFPEKWHNFVKTKLKLDGCGSVRRFHTECNSNTMTPRQKLPTGEVPVLSTIDEDIEINQLGSKNESESIHSSKKTNGSSRPLMSINNSPIPRNRNDDENKNPLERQPSSGALQRQTSLRNGIQRQQSNPRQNGAIGNLLGRINEVQQQSNRPSFLPQLRTPSPLPKIENMAPSLPPIQESPSKSISGGNTNAGDELEDSIDALLAGLDPIASARDNKSPAGSGENSGGLMGYPPTPTNKNSENNNNNNNNMKNENRSNNNKIQKDIFSSPLAKESSTIIPPLKSFDNEKISVPLTFTKRNAEDFNRVLVWCHAISEHIPYSQYYTVGDAGTSHAYKMFHGHFPNLPHEVLRWLNDRPLLKRIMGHAYRLAFKIALDAFVDGDMISEVVEDHVEFTKMLVDLETKWHIGPQDERWCERLAECEHTLFTLLAVSDDGEEIDPSLISASNVSGLQISTEKGVQFTVFDANAAFIHGFWHSISQEIQYFTSDDDERFSIQSLPHAARNLTVQAAEPPLGYSVFQSAASLDG